jgi:predicted RNA methylase
MKKFVIERDLPGAGNLSEEELQAISKTSNSAISVIGQPYRWVESFVTKDKIYCIHEAESEDVIRQHASCANFPVTVIEEVKIIINPATARD